MSAGFEVRWIEEVGSTNEHLVSLARSGQAVVGTAVVARYQSAGRGRRGRTWEAPPGSSLLVSVALAVPPDYPQLLTIAAALAAREACRKESGFQPELKWPNDLTARQCKLAGVLADLGTPEVAVVGLGLNVDWGDVPLPPGAISLAELSGQSVPVDSLLSAYLDALAPRAAARRTLLEEYRTACVTIGQLVRVELPASTVEGVATSVTDSGHLVVGSQEISAGDVVHIRSVSTDAVSPNSVAEAPPGP